MKKNEKRYFYSTSIHWQSSLHIWHHTSGPHLFLVCWLLLANRPCDKGRRWVKKDVLKDPGEEEIQEVTSSLAAAEEIRRWMRQNQSSGLELGGFFPQTDKRRSRKDLRWGCSGCFAGTGEEKLGTCSGWFRASIHFDFTLNNGSDWWCAKTLVGRLETADVIIKRRHEAT